MTLYRIYTETKPGLAKLVSRYLEGFTLSTALGYWESRPEQATLIEVAAACDASGNYVVHLEENLSSQTK